MKLGQCNSPFPSFNDIFKLNSIITQIIQSNYYTITKETLDNYNKIVQTCSLTIIPSISSKQIQLPTKPSISNEAKANIIKLTLLALNDFIHNSKFLYYEYTLSLIQNLFKQRFFIEEEILLLFCFIIQLTIEKSEEEYIALAFKCISNIFSMLVINTFSQKMITNFVEFLITINNENVLSFKLNRLNLFSLFQFDRDEINDLMAPMLKFINDISLFKYNSYLFDSLISSLINQFGKDSLSKVPSNTIRFIKELIEKEVSIKTKDNFYFFNRFYFSNNQNKGISLSEFMFPSSLYTIIFSFQLKIENSRSNLCIPLITFSLLEPNNTSKPLIIYIDENQKLCIKLNDLINTDIEILNDKSYVVLISQNRSLFNIQVNNISKTFSNSKMSNLKGDKCSMSIGYYYTDMIDKTIKIPFTQFHGYFGTVILFKNYFTSEMIQRFNKVKGQYDSLLNCNLIFDHMNTTVSINAMALEYFSQRKQMDYLVEFISPQYVNFSKMTQLRNAKDNSTNIFQLKVNGTKCSIDKMIYPYSLSFSLDEFLKLEGIKFIQLNLEYYQQLLENGKVTKNNELLKSISKEITNIFTLITLILEFSDRSYFLNKPSPYDPMCTFIDLPINQINFNSNEIVLLFDSYANCLLSIASISPKHIESNLNELLYFISVCLFQEDSNELLFTLKTKLIYFLFNKSLYESNNKHQLSCFVSVLTDCLNNDPEGLFNKDFLMAMLTFADDAIEGYDEMLRTYLEISFKQSHELFTFFFYIIANEDKGINVLVKMLLSLFAFCLNLPPQDRKHTLNSVSLDKLIINKINDLNNNVNSESVAENIAIGILIQLIRFVSIDTKDINRLFKSINMNEIVFRSVVFLLYQPISIQKFLPPIISNTGFKEFTIDSKNQLIDKDLDFWFEIVIKCYMRIEIEEMKSVAYDIIIELIEKQIRNLNDKDSKSKFYHVLHSKNILTKLFYKKGLNESSSNDIMRITKMIIPKHPKPFIFSLLFKFYVQIEDKFTIRKAKLRNNIVYIKEDNNNSSSYCADTESVSIEMDSQGIIDDSTNFDKSIENKFKDSSINSWETQIDHLGLIVKSLFQYMASEIEHYNQTQTIEDVTIEIRKNILVNNINLYIFLYKVFCLQKSINDNKKKIRLFKAIESDLMLNSNFFYFYSLPLLRISFPIGDQSKFVLEILFDLYNEFLLLTDNQKYFGHFVSYLTFDLEKSSFLYEADAFFMFNTKPTDLNINIKQFLQLEQLLASIPKLKKEDISLTLFYLIKFTVILLKNETFNHKISHDFYLFLNQFTIGLFNETQKLFSSIKKSTIGKSDYSEKYYVRIKKEVIEKKKWKIADFIGFIYKIRIKEKEEIDKVFIKLLFDKAGHIIEEETHKKGNKSFMFGRESVNAIPRKLSGEEEIYFTPINNDSNLNEIKAKDIYAKYLKEQKFDLDYKSDYSLFNFPITNLKKTFLHIVFGYHFRNVLFNDEGFIELKKEFQSLFSVQLIEPNQIEYLPYPTKLKNYCINYVSLFLKPAMSYLFKNPQLVKVAYRDLHYHSVSYQKLKYFKNRLNKVKLTNEIESYWGELVSLEGISFGLICLSKNYLQFKAFSEKDPRLTNKLNDIDRLMFVLSSLDSDILIQTKSILFRYSDIKLLLKKRYIYSMIASEFYLFNGKSYFFNLFTEDKNNSFLSSINTISNKPLINISQSVIDCFILNDYPGKWKRKEISTFTYLLLLNITSRSFNDKNQYPIFPWIEIKNTQGNIVQRDFEYPISVQDENKRKKLIYQYDNLETSFKNHFNIHFSTSLFVIYYLIRLNPFTYNMIKFQTGIFDLPERIFHSYDEILDILKEFNDNRELVPEVFYLPEMFVNLNYFNYGCRHHDNIQLHNVLLLNMNPASFVLRNRKMLDNPRITSNIHRWIDNVFGVNQINTSKGTCNTFMKFCYEENMNLTEKANKKLKMNVPPEEIWTKLRQKISLILNFGQTPQRIFKEKHPTIIIDKIEVNYSTPLSSESFSLLTIAKEFICFKSIVQGGKYKGIYFISKDKGVYNSLISFDKPVMKPKKFTFEYIKYIDRNNSKSKKKAVYNGKNLFEVFYTLFGEVNLFCNYYDNSIKFYIDDINESFEFILESFTSAVEKISESKFITGHINGKIIIWEFDFDKVTTRFKLRQLKSFLQQSRINLIVYCLSLNILFISDEKGEVCIRNLVTLELLTVIHPRGESHKRNLLIANIAISKYNYIYISGYDGVANEFYLFGYTLNGVLFSKTKMLSQDFQLMPNDTIFIFGRSPQNKARFLSVNPTDFKEIIYYSNTSSINQVSHFVLCFEKKYIYITDYLYDKLQIALLSDDDVNNYCNKAFFI